MRKDDDRRIGREAGEVGFQPLDLPLAEDRRRIGGVVEHDEVDALVVEGVVERPADDLLVRLAAVERGVVLALEEPDLGHGQRGGLLLEFAQTLSPHFRIVGRLRQVAGEDDEIGLLLECIDGCDGALERPACFRVHFWVRVPPVHVGELDEREVPLAAALPSELRASRQAGGEYESADAGESHEVASAITLIVHGASSAVL